MVTNAGPDAANLTTVTDSIPAALTGVAAVCGSPVGGAVCGAVNLSGNNLSSTITTLPANGSVTFTITGTTPSSGTLVNSSTAIVPSGVSDPDDPARTGAGNNTSANVTTIVQSPDLRLTKVASSPTFTVGSSVSFTLQPSNSGTLATSGLITVVDTLPPGLSYVAAGSGGSGWSCGLSGQDVTCTSSNVIAAGGNGAAITINVQVLSNAVPGITNTATVSGGNEPAANSGNNSAVLNVSVSGAAVNTFLTDGAQTGTPSSSVLYTHSFNAGSAGAVAFTYVHAPSPNIGGWSVQLYRDNNCNGLLDGSDGTVEITGTSFPVTAGQQICLITKSNIPAAAPAGALDVISVTATFTPSSGPVVTYARVDVTTVGAATGAGLVLTKSVRNVTQSGSVGTINSARPGDVLEYVITYSNSSNSPLATINVSDATPAFTTFVSASCMTPPYPNNITACAVSTQPSVGAAGSIQWQLTGSLGAGRSGTVVFRVTVQ